MILGFKTTFPWGEPTHFVQKISCCVPDEYKGYTPKLHTIREGQRWKEGDLIHMAVGVRSKNYFQFNSKLPTLQRVKGVQRIDIFHRGPDCSLICIDKEIKFSRWRATARQKQGGGRGYFGWYSDIGTEWFEQFWKNDGFDCEADFWKWFSKTIRNGQLIHWTELKY